MTTLYMVMGSTGYDDASPICCFSREAQAQAFVDICNAYSSNRPPIDADTLNNHKLYKAYREAVKTWDERHPAGAAEADNESFYVATIPCYHTIYEVPSYNPEECFKSLDVGEPPKLEPGRGSC